ncbi:MAG: DUF4349 domain-containing protein [Anaerolineaceae bacterium]|nr:DUF4349 domain-containing protein [Anaerolineaceae bacterium]
MKKNIVFLLIILPITAMLIAGCAPKASAPYPDYAESRGQVPMLAPQTTSMPMASMEEGTSFSDISASGNSVKRIVIKNADLSIVVKDPADSMASIGLMAETMGGFIVSSQVYKTNTDEGIEVPVADITVRIPADRLEEAMDSIKDLVSDPSKDILSENVSGQDVTKEYTDLQSRLKNLQNAEAQLERIMESATKTEDVLNVYSELTRVQEQIEVIKGQIKYFDEASQLSALRVYLQSQESVKPLTIGGWQPAGIARDALQALIDTLKFLANAVIWIVIFCLPVGILVGIPGWLIIRAARRWWLKRKLLKQQNTPPKEGA